VCLYRTFESGSDTLVDVQPTTGGKGRDPAAVWR